MDTLQVATGQIAEVTWSTRLLDMGQELLISAIVIFVFGLIVKRHIENIKNKWTLEREISKEKVMKIAECWAKHEKFQIAFFKLHCQVKDFIETFIKPKNQTNEEMAKNEPAKLARLGQLKEECMKLQKEVQEVRHLILVHRFWFNKEVYLATCLHYKKYREYLHDFCSDQYEQCQEDWKGIHEDLMNGKLNADSVLQMLSAS